VKLQMEKPQKALKEQRQSPIRVAPQEEFPQAGPS